jgi:rod shape-determining protein MreB
MSSVSLIRYLREKYNLLIGEKTADAILTQLTATAPTPEDCVESITIRGRSLVTGFPTLLGLTRYEFRQALSLPQAPESSQQEQP